MSWSPVVLSTLLISMLFHPPNPARNILITSSVLNPNNTAVMPSPSATTGSPAFSGASSASAPPFTSGVPTPTMAIGGGATMSVASSAGGGSATMSGSGSAAATTGAAA